MSLSQGLSLYSMTEKVSLNEKGWEPMAWLITNRIIRLHSLLNISNLLL